MQKSGCFAELVKEVIGMDGRKKGVLAGVLAILVAAAAAIYAFFKSREGWE